MPLSPSVSDFRRVVLLLTTLFSAGAVFAATPKRNVLFIAVDDLRPSLGCYGEKEILSPNIDALAREGTRFERAYCQVSVCNPSRNSLLSGERPDTIKIYDNSVYLRPLNPDVLTLPEHFKNNGWHTASVGKIFHHSASEPGDDPQSWSEPSWYHGTPYGHWFTPESKAFVEALKKLPEGKRPKALRGPPYESADVPDDRYPDAQTAAQAIATLRRLKDQPFFLGVGFIKPHLPFTCPKKYWDLYPPETIKLPADYDQPGDVPADARHNLYELRTYGGIDPKADPTREQALNMVRAYRACISFMDAQVGRVLAALDELGLRDNTIVVLWGDHGYHLGENNLWTKMTNFEICTRVPLIIRVPGQANRGAASSGLVELIDLYPSLAELCGLPLPAHLEGTSFAPLLADPKRPWKTAAFSQYARSYSGRRDKGKKPPMGYSMRTAKYRYTEWFDPAGKPVGVELYDQEADPLDRNNLANAPEQAALKKTLAAQLHAGWRAAVPPGSQPAR
jgi:arylsulfatase A-like enzyme